jgi:hypothetical protein
MKITITKKIKHSLLIEESELRALFNFLSSKYEKFWITTRCIDGSALETIVIDDFFNFENPNKKRIRSITIRAFSSDFDERVFLDIITDGSLLFSYNKTELTVESRSQETAEIVTNTILSRLFEMKPWYDFLARYPIYNVLLVFFLGISPLVFLGYFLGFIRSSNISIKLPLEEVLGVIFLFVMGFLSVETILYTIQCYLFPKIFFMIGKQKKGMEIRIKWRYFLGVTIFISFVISLIANSISAKFR